MHCCGIRRLMYPLASGEDASCLQALVYGWHEYLSDMKLTRSAEQPAALRRQLHGKHAHVIEKAFSHRHCSDSTSRLHTVMQYWTDEVDQAHNANERAAHLAAKQHVRQEHGNKMA